LGQELESEAAHRSRVIFDKNAPGWRALTWTQLFALIVVAWCGFVVLATVAGVALAAVKVALRLGWAQTDLVIRILKPW